eukprot:1851715-Rhodomonas_salina.2
MRFLVFDFGVQHTCKAVGATPRDTALQQLHRTCIPDLSTGHPIADRRATSSTGLCVRRANVSTGHHVGSAYVSTEDSTSVPGIAFAERMPVPDLVTGPRVGTYQGRRRVLLYPALPPRDTPIAHGPSQHRTLPTAVPDIAYFITGQRLRHYRTLPTAVPDIA